jgi:hypothetical protein
VAKNNYSYLTFDLEGKTPAHIFKFDHQPVFPFGECKPTISIQKIIQETNFHFVIAPVASGVELFQFKSRVFDEASLITISHKICEGIKYYHEFGIICNRIHFNNIIIDGKVSRHLHETESKYVSNISSSVVKSEILQIGHFSRNVSSESFERASIIPSIIS